MTTLLFFSHAFLDMLGLIPCLHFNKLVFGKAIHYFNIKMTLNSMKKNFIYWHDTSCLIYSFVNPSFKKH